MTARARKVAIELSRERICEGALVLIDRDGLDAFSTRKLGLLLGCEAMALYYYYPNKEALLDAVVDTLIAGVAAAIDGAGEWVDVLRRVAHAYRRIAHDHPRAFPLLATRRFSSEDTYAFLEKLFEFARRHGVADRDAARFYRVVSSYCNGFALNELATPPKTTAGVRKRFARVAAVSEWLAPPYLDETFGFGLELLLDALTTKARP